MGDAWCDSLPSCDYPYPSSIGTVVETLSSRATMSRDPWIWRDNCEVVTPKGSGIVYLDGSAWFWPTHFDEAYLEGGHSLGGGGESTKFSFGGRRHDKFHYLGDRENWSVMLREGVVFGDKDVGTSSTAAL